MRCLTLAFILVMAAFAWAGDPVGTQPAGTQSAAVEAVAIQVRKPEPVASDAAAIEVEVNFQNNTKEDAVIVWEKVRSIRVFKKHLLVGTNGWGSDKAGWITLKPGEKAKRTVTLKIGEDIPALDPGAYTVALDFKIESPVPTHLQMEVPLKVTGEVPANSLATIVKTAATFQQGLKPMPGAERVAVEEWELTPNMYAGMWKITFSEKVPGGFRVATVCVDKKTGEAKIAPPIP